MTESTHLNQFRLMALYNLQHNDRTYDLAASLTEEERRRDFGAYFKSIHGTLNHMLLGDRIWLRRFAPVMGYLPHEKQLAFSFESLAQILYEDFGELRQERKETDEMIDRWMNSLHPELLSAPMSYANSLGVEREHSLWFGLSHFFNHQTHHRSQAITMLHQLGHNYGVTDLIAMYDVAKKII
jgi:uncharacterized damage-inducible protein DinB